MKRLLLLLFLLVPLALQAQTFQWNVDFQTLFNNYEHDRSGNVYESSRTIFGARLTPAVGVQFRQNGSLTHSVMAGVDLFRNFGGESSVSGMVEDFVFYYRLDGKFRGHRRLGAYMGSFSRSSLEGDYLNTVFADHVMFLDHNIEGAMVKYRAPRIFAELAVDWMGMFDDSVPQRREQFKILTGGDWNFAGSFHLGWTGAFTHYAYAPQIESLVDYNLLNPWIGWSPKKCFLDELQVNAGALLSYQADRCVSSQPVFPAGLLLRQKALKWHVRLDNTFFYGSDMMPFYERSAGGVQYGSNLYLSDLCFHTRMDGASWFDILNVSYERKVRDWLSFSVGCSFHLGQKNPTLGTPVFRGWQQIVDLKVNLSRKQNQNRNK